MVPVDDIKRVKKFYAELFGWEIKKLPGPMDYYEIKTGSSEGKTGLGGGMAKRQKFQETIANYIDVPSIDEFIKKAEEFGGKVVTPKMPVPGEGYVAVCLDTGNNTFGLWETDKKAQMNWQAGSK
jgi:predicted enzyme related to lactoylglutathione lyase